MIGLSRLKEMVEEEMENKIKELEEKLLRKEQECEEFRKANDEKNELLAKLGCPTIATAKRKVFCLQEQIDKLKVENDSLKKQLKFEFDETLLQYSNTIEDLQEQLKNSVMQKCPQCGEVYLSPTGCELHEENSKLERKIKEIKNVLSISYDLWMYHIANGIGNSDNRNTVEALKDFSVAIRLLADTLDESDGYLSYSTNESKIYKIRKEELQKMNEVKDVL